MRRRFISIKGSGMLFLTFSCAGGRFALPTQAIERVLPFAVLEPAAGAAENVAGYLMLKGVPVAVIDLNQVLSGSAAAVLYSTRIAVLKGTGPGRAAVLIEGATRVARGEKFLEAGPAGSGAYSVGIFSQEGLSYQVIDAEKVLSSVFSTVFPSEHQKEEHQKGEAA